jgi:hypothetical protein
MASVREHLREVHGRQAAHSLARAKFHKAMSGHFKKLAALSKTAKSEMDDGDAMDLFDSAAAEHNEMADECVSMGEYHAACAKALADGNEPAAAKAMMGMSDAERRTAVIAPDQVSAVAPPAAVHGVPRYGAPTLPENSPVPAAFEKMVALD